MGARFRVRWQKIRKPLAVIAAIALSTGVLVLLILEGYRLTWTGFFNKTLWDWLQLISALAIPVVVGFGAVWFTTRQGKVSNAENKDNQRETALQGYIDKMSELLLKEHLGELTADGKLKPEYKRVRDVARVQTIAVLTQLDGRRVGYVFTFLQQESLISSAGEIPSDYDYALNFFNADLHAVIWRNADLSDADLSGANLRGADLSYANLGGANLSYAHLRGADLRGAFFKHILNIPRDAQRAA
jgi:hypothetical protein